MSDPAFALSLAIVVALIYLVVLRLIDVNEKEPFWALGLVLFAGAFAGGLAFLLVPSTFRTLNVLGIAVTAEVAKFLALGVSVAALEGVGRARGFSELNGLVDGVVYGAAVGLGFAVGETFAREAAVGGATLVGGGALTAVWTTALSGLSEGVFGAILGAGIGGALAARSAAQRALLPVAGLIAALIVHYGYVAFAQGGSLAGDQGFVRAWIALLLPLLLVVVVMVQGLVQERGAIAEELADEAAGGAVTEAELARLRSPGARRGAYARALAKGDLTGFMAQRSLQNRQVQLALTERRSRRETDPTRKAAIDDEVHAIRAAILAAKQEAGTGGRAPVGEGGAR